MPIWVAAVLLLAALKVGFGVAAFFVGTPVSPTPGGLPPVPPTLSLLHMAVYSVVGGMLVLNGHRDRRALALGGAFIGLAAAGSDRLFIHLTEGPDWVSTAVGYLSHLHPDAFLPLFIWLFFRDFPRAPTTPMWQKITQAGIGLTAAAGTLLFALHAAPLITPQTTSSVTSSVLLLFQPSSNLYLYTWVTVIGLTLPAFVLAIWKIRSAPDQERRRVGLLLAGLLIGSSPMLLGILLGALIPAVRGWMDDPSHRWLNHYVFRPFLMVIPVTTAYSVLVQHALDVKLVARRAIRYALARYAVLAGTAIPFAGLVLYLYQHRQETLTELLSGLRPLLLIAATAFGLVVFRLRRKVLHLIDRRFFREHYDSHQILLSLVEGSRR